MIRAEFRKSQGFLTGFKLSGHAGLAESGHDVACAAVSSAVQLTVNMLDSLGYSPKVRVGENVISCISPQEAVPSKMLEQLRLHLEAVLEEFPNTIKITTSEV